MPFEIPDVNVLGALALGRGPQRERARSWLGGTERFATTPITESGVIRLLINPRVSGSIISASSAWEWLMDLREHPRSEFLADDAALAEPRVDPKLIRGHRQVTDFHLLDLAVRHDAVLVTFDRGIERAFGRQHGDSIRVL